MRIMKIRTLFLTLFLSICYSGFSQDITFQQKIIKYLKLNGTEQQYNNAYDEMFVMLNQQFSNASVPEAEWSSLKINKEEDIAKVLGMLASAYRKHFT